ncbi:hypothetical protein PG996_006681 [Apiospora saccharicola]|uniref:Uncharacterized protein n=1 Tax=Apiospora saccharicola TaxID=335842 RepID=A0ABR1V8N9_9PEZI
MTTPVPPPPTPTQLNSLDSSSTPPSELLQMVKSLPRDRYGFTDYNTFAAKTKLDILPPEFCSPPPHCKSVMMDFQGYDAMTNTIRSRLHANINPPAKQGHNVEIRVVVDLDSNINGCGIGMVSREMKNLKLVENNGGGGESLVNGYDRYFARPTAWDWWADVSGYEPPKEGGEGFRLLTRQQL